METALILFLVVVLLIFCSSFFSGSETALTAVSRAKIHRLRMEGNKAAERVSKLRKNKERLLGALLLGNNVVNIAASALLTSLSIRYFGEEKGVLYATIFMTLMVLIFGEVLPKTVAFHKSEKVALLVSAPMTFIVKIFSPVTIMVQMAVSIFLRTVGLDIRAEESKEAYDKEALRGAIDLSHYEGKMVKRDRDMLGGVLDLGHREVSEIMTHRRNMETLDSSLSPQEIVKQVIESNHTRIPIWQDNPDNIIGILHAQALLKVVRSVSEANITTENILSVIAEPWFIPETTTLIDQLAAFRRKRNHVALVVDEYGDLMGLVTLEDILEEIVGQIYDETDKLVQGVKSLSDGTYKVKGNVTIRDLNRRLGWNLPDDNASTVAGLLMYEAQAVPDEGQSFEFYSCEFTVLKREGNQISFLQLRGVPNTDAS